MDANPNHLLPGTHPMISLDDSSHPPDICLLLRSHSEQQWLSSRLLPVLVDLERPEGVPDDQLGAALAYLELQWIDARRRAGETDVALAQLDRAAEEQSELFESARAYHAAVKSLRDALRVRVGVQINSQRSYGAQHHAC